MPDIKDDIGLPKLQINSADLVIAIRGEISEITEAFGARLPKTSVNPYIQNARGKLEAYNQVLEFIRSFGGL